MKNNEQVMGEWARSAMGAAMLACLAILSSCQRREPVIGSAATVYWLDDFYPIIPIAINGYKTQALVDSGFSGCIKVAEHDARHAKLSDANVPTQHGADMAGNIYEYRVLPAITLGIGTESQVIPSVDSCEETESLLGAIWLARNQAVIDYPRQLVALPPPRSPDALSEYTPHRLITMGYRQVPCHIHNGQMFTNVSIASSRFTFAIDTGTGRTKIDEDVARTLGMILRDKRTVPLSKQSFFNEYSVGLQALTLDSITVSCKNLTTVNLDSINTFMKKRRRPHMDGIIGSDVLNKYGAIFNYHDMALYLRD